MRRLFDDLRARTAVVGGVIVALLFGVFAYTLVSAATHGFAERVSQRFLSVAGRIAAVSPDSARAVAKALSAEHIRETAERGLRRLEEYGFTPETTMQVDPVLQRAANLSALAAVVAVLAGLSCTVLGAYALARLLRSVDALASSAAEIAAGRYQLEARAQSEGSLGRLSFQIRQSAHRLKEQAEVATEERERLRDFLSDMSHQLKTPLSSLRMYHELLMEMEEAAAAGEGLPGGGAAPDAEQTSGAQDTGGARGADDGGPAADEPKARDLSETRGRFLRRSLAQIDRMEWLVKNLLTEARLSAGSLALSLESQDLGATVAAVIPAFRARAEASGIDLSCRLPDSGPAVAHDRRWLGEAISNVVKNAIDHTPRGGTVSVVVHSSDVFARIVVEDSGPGISAEDLPHIFERFYRGRGASGDAASESTGLGLALAKAIVRRHGGTISATTGRTGARFTITLTRL